MVGTKTLRRARDSEAFLEAAAQSLGHPVEVIAGPEEARLIDLGVAHDITDHGRRLVVDIGGGPTECIVGEAYEPLEAHSLYMGCVGWPQRLFKNGRISTHRMFTAGLAAETELEPIARIMRTLGSDRAIGASGTINAVESVLAAQGWSQASISAAGAHRPGPARPLPAEWAGQRVEAVRLLRWGARRHELGLTLSWRGHQKHGTYRVQHADLPGFSLIGQRILAALVDRHSRTVDPTTSAALGSRSAGPPCASA